MSYLDACRSIPGLIGYWPHDDSISPPATGTLRDAAQMFPRRSRVGELAEIDKDKYNAWGGACVMSNDQALVAYAKRASNVATSTEIYKSTSSDGATWSKPTVMATSPKGYFWRVVALTTLSTDRIVLITSLTGSTPQHPVVLLSDDDSETWSEYSVAHGFEDFCKTGGPVFELGSGKLLAPLYGRDAEEEDPYTRISYSTDGGKTWKDLGVEIRIPEYVAVEPSIEELADDRLIMTIRAETEPEEKGQPLGIYVSFSEDDGATWSEPARAIPSACSRAVALTVPDDGSTWAILRREKGAGSAKTVAYGTFDGERWGLPVDLEVSSENSSQYGQFIWWNEALWAVWFAGLSGPAGVYAQALELEEPGVPMELTASEGFESGIEGPTEREAGAKGIDWNKHGVAETQSDIPAVENALMNNQYSIAIWVKDAMTGTPPIFTLSSAALLGSQTNGRVRFVINGKTPLNSSEIKEAGWHLVVVTYDEGSAKLYVDGIEDKSEEKEAPTSIKGGLAIAKTAAYGNKSSLACFWDTVLVPAQIWRLWKELTLSVKDSVAISDSAARTAAHLASDAVTLSDALGKRADRAALDALGVTDTVSKASERTLVDNVDSSD